MAAGTALDTGPAEALAGSLGTGQLLLEVAVAGAEECPPQK